MNSEPLQTGYSPLCRVKSKTQQSAGPPAPHTARPRECRRRAGKGTPGRRLCPLHTCGLWTVKQSMGGRRK